MRLKNTGYRKGKTIKRLMAIYQNWQFVKTRSRISKHNVQFQTNNRFLPLEETTEDLNKTENGDQEEIYRNNNILTIQKERQQCRRPECPIMENYNKTGGSCIKNKKLKKNCTGRPKIFRNFVEYSENWNNKAKSYRKIK